MAVRGRGGEKIGQAAASGVVAAAAAEADRKGLAADLENEWGLGGGGYSN